MLDNLFPIQPSNPLEYCRLFSYKIARFITYFCIDDTCIHREDVTIKLEDARLLANNMRDLADEYEGMVEAMYHEHDFGVKEMQEGNTARNIIEQLNKKIVYMRQKAVELRAVLGVHGEESRETGRLLDELLK